MAEYHMQLSKELVKGPGSEVMALARWWVKQKLAMPTLVQRPWRILQSGKSGAEFYGILKTMLFLFKISLTSRLPIIKENEHLQITWKLSLVSGEYIT